MISEISIDFIKKKSCQKYNLLPIDSNLTSKKKNAWFKISQNQA